MSSMSGISSSGPSEYSTALVQREDHKKLRSNAASKQAHHLEKDRACWGHRLSEDLGDEKGEKARDPECLVG